MIHYVYRITRINPTSDRKYYVGKRSGQLDDLKTLKYKTSSKNVQPIFNTDEWKVKIVGVFDSAEEAIRFEAKYHWRVDAARHHLFYNEANQSSDGGFDRTNLVTVIDKIHDKRLTITCDEYYENKDRYMSIYSMYVRAKTLDTNVNKLVTKEIFDNDDNLVGINKNILHVYDNIDCVNKTISKTEFHTNKYRYEHTLKDKISAYDIIDNKKCSVTKEVFYANPDRYIGIKAFTKERKCLCNICNKEISASNIERHKNAHHSRKIWVTDLNNTNTYRCDEYTFYTELMNEYYITPGNGYEGEGFINGTLHNLRYVGRINKFLPTELLDEIIKKNSLIDISQQEES